MERQLSFEKHFLFGDTGCNLLSTTGVVIQSILGILCILSLISKPNKSRKLLKNRRGFGKFFYWTFSSKWSGRVFYMGLIYILLFLFRLKRKKANLMNVLGILRFFLLILYQVCYLLFFFRNFRILYLENADVCLWFPGIMFLIIKGNWEY